MASERNLISIANHPTLKDVTRKVAIVKSQPYYNYSGLPDNENVKSKFKKSIILDLLILHFDKEGNYFKLGNNDGLVYLTSDENDYVNPATFEKVEKDEEGNYPKGSVLEYDALWDLVYTKKVKTDIELQEMFISLREDKINEKLYS